MKNVLALSSLVHPSRFISQSAQIRELFTFLSVIKIACDSSKEEMHLTWRPHPEELWIYSKTAAQAKVEIDSRRGLEESIAASDVVVCALSGCITTTLALGKVPLVWADEVTENCGLWRDLPDQVRFSNSSELLDRIDETARCSAEIRELVISRIGPGKSQSPPPEFFRSAAKYFNTMTNEDVFGDGQNFFGPQTSGS